MGQVAAEILVRRIEGWSDYPQETAIEPELVVRESSGPPTKSQKNL